MMSRHAAVRAQQRAIPPIVVDWVVAYGRAIRHKGADTYYLDRKVRKKLKCEIGSIAFRRMEDLLDVYVVVSDDYTVITVGWRYKRLRH